MALSPAASTAPAQSASGSPTRSTTAAQPVAQPWQLLVDDLVRESRLHGLLGVHRASLRWQHEQVPEADITRALMHALPSLVSTTSADVARARTGAGLPDQAPTTWTAEAPTAAAVTPATTAAPTSAGAAPTRRALAVGWIGRAMAAEARAFGVALHQAHRLHQLTGMAALHSGYLGAMAAMTSTRLSLGQSLPDAIREWGASIAAPAGQAARVEQGIARRLLAPLGGETFGAMQRPGLAETLTTALLAQRQQPRTALATLAQAALGAGQLLAAALTHVESQVATQGQTQGATPGELVPGGLPRVRAVPSPVATPPAQVTPIAPTVTTRRQAPQQSM